MLCMLLEADNQVIRYFIAVLKKCVAKHIFPVCELDFEETLKFVVVELYKEGS